MKRALALALVLLGGCGPHRQPPPRLMFEGLPVTGSLADARRAGFIHCVQPDYISMRCRRHGVMLEGGGPYEAAVDLIGGDGSGGFYQVVLWHDQDQYAVYKATDGLEHTGWWNCTIGTPDEKGDQLIYSRAGEKVRISMDLSYWAKRRLRILPQTNTREWRC